MVLFNCTDIQIDIKRRGTYIYVLYLCLRSFIVNNYKRLKVFRNRQLYLEYNRDIIIIVSTVKKGKINDEMVKGHKVLNGNPSTDDKNKPL